MSLRVRVAKRSDLVLIRVFGIAELLYYNLDSHSQQNSGWNHRCFASFGMTMVLSGGTRNQFDAVVNVNWVGVSLPHVVTALMRLLSTLALIAFRTARADGISFIPDSM